MTRRQRTREPSVAERVAAARLAGAHEGQPAHRPPEDPAFDAELLAFLHAAMARGNGEARARRVSFGEHDIRMEFGVCTVTCHTHIEWLGADGRRRLVEADHAEGSAKHGALIRLLGQPAVAARLLPEGLQVDIDGAGTLHFARVPGGISFEVTTAEFGPALY